MLVNIYLLNCMLPRGHPSAYPKRHVDRFSRFAQLTAKDHYTLQWAAPFPIKNCPSHRGIWTPI